MLILSLGSNLGNRSANLKKATDHLGKIMSSIKISPIYESDALLPENAPDSWNIPFLNLIISAKCEIVPEILLKNIKEIEKIVGREESTARWSPRIIDIDIIAYDSYKISDDELSIPHKHFSKRAFVIFPLADLHPEIIINPENKTAKELAESLKNKEDLLHTKITGIVL